MASTQNTQDRDGLILALDQGTTSSRAIIFDKQAQALAVGQNTFNQYYPHPGWVEHDALEILSSQIAAVTEALVVGNIDPAHIRCIGITNQRETTVLWDRQTGVPVAPAIVWQCRRTTSMIEELAADPATFERIRQSTGLVPDAYFSASKIKWLLDTLPGVRERAARGELAFGTVDSWLVWQLTGGTTHATDYTNASRTMLFNIHKGCWDEWLLNLFDVPQQILPEVRPSAAFYGRTAHPSVPANIPICGIAGDQQAALFGQACFAPGEAKNTYGTGCFMLMHTGTEAPLSKNQLLTTIAASAPGSPTIAALGTTDDEASSVPVASVAPTASATSPSSTSSAAPAASTASATPAASTSSTASAASDPSDAPQLEYAIEGSVFVAGALIQWLRDELGLIETAAETQALARSVPDTAGVYIVPAFTGLGAPYWDMEARGALLGLTRGTSKAHIVRAALEAMAFQLSDLVEAVQADTSLAIKHLKVDGGAAANDFLLQFQSDILGADIIRPRNSETTALGAAFLAGLSCGLWQSTDELRALVASDDHTVFSSHMNSEQRQVHLEGWRKAIARVLS